MLCSRDTRSKLPMAKHLICKSGRDAGVVVFVVVVVCYWRKFQIGARIICTDCLGDNPELLTSCCKHKADKKITKCIKYFLPHLASRKI